MAPILLSFVPMSVCLKGTLDDFSVSDILQTISLGRKTGYLCIEAEMAGGAVVFRKGRVLASVDDGCAPLEAELEGSSPEQRDQFIRRRIAASLARLARSRRGYFIFQASAQPPRIVVGRDIGRETLDAGIEVVDLLVELVCSLEPQAVPGAA
jgi:hypothetical protein